MTRNAFRSLLGRLQRLGFLSLVMIWIAVLRVLPQDIPKNFP